MNIRVASSVTSSKVGIWSAGQSVNYDSKVLAGGYVWLSRIGTSDGRRYSEVV